MQPRTTVTLLLLLLSLLACCCQAGKYKPLLLNHIQIKGTHNSYHVKSEPTLPMYNYTHVDLFDQLNTQGVRQVELDIRYDAAHNKFPVFHLPHYDPKSNCDNFEECLRKLDRWSRGVNRSHVPIFVWVELKNKSLSVSQWDAFDNICIRVVSRDRIMTPDDIRGASGNLRDALTQRGWPELEKVRGKFVFVFDEVYPSYAVGHPNLRDRVAFFSHSYGQRFAPEAAFLKMNEAAILYLDILKAVSENYIVRTRADEGYQPTVLTQEETLRSFLAVLDKDHDGRISIQDIHSYVFVDGYDFKLNVKLTNILQRCLNNSGSPPVLLPTTTLTPTQLWCVLTTAQQVPSTSSVSNVITQRNRAVRSGAHIVSTDYPAPPKEGDGYFVEFSAQCNAVTTEGYGDKPCQKEDIEGTLVFDINNVHYDNNNNNMYTSIHHSNNNERQDQTTYTLMPVVMVVLVVSVVVLMLLTVIIYRRKRDNRRQQQQHERRVGAKMAGYQLFQLQ